MSTEGAALRYYRANEGRWQGAFRFELTDLGALRVSPLGTLDRLRVRLLSFVMSLFGAFTMRTSVTVAPGGAQVLHTTRLSKWGLPLYDAAETFALAEDGASFTVARRERFWPSPFFVTEPDGGRGEVEPSGARARYVFRFFGAELHQTGAIEPGGVRITQSMPFARGAVLLARIAR